MSETEFMERHESIIHSVCRLLFNWFKREGIVEHLLNLCTRYMRTWYIFPEQEDQIYTYLSGWILYLRYLRKHLDAFIAADDDLVPTAERTQLDIQRFFRRKIDWVVIYFELCRDATPSTLNDFNTFSSDVRLAWGRWNESLRQEHHQHPEPVKQ